MLKFREEVLERVARETEERLGLADEAPALVRVDVKHVENLRLMIKTRDDGKHIFWTDEPKNRGGEDTAPAPLPYFIAGAASCFLMQCVKVAGYRMIDVDDVEVTCVGRFDRRVGEGFREIVYEVKVKGAEDLAKVREMVSEAERMCFAHRTLSKAVKTRLRLYYNGRLVEER